MVISPFYSLEILRASLHVTKSFFPYFYYLSFARKIPFCSFMHPEIKAKETRPALVEENKSTRPHFVNGLDPQSESKIWTQIFS